MQSERVLSQASLHREVLASDVHREHTCTSGKPLGLQLHTRRAPKGCLVRASIHHKAAMRVIAQSHKNAAKMATMMYVGCFAITVIESTRTGENAAKITLRKWSVAGHDDMFPPPRAGAESVALAPGFRFNVCLCARVPRNKVRKTDRPKRASSKFRRATRQPRESFSSMNGDVESAAAVPRKSVQIDRGGDPYRIFQCHRKRRHGRATVQVCRLRWRLAFLPSPESSCVVPPKCPHQRRMKSSSSRAVGVWHRLPCI